MTRDDIIRMAREAHGPITDQWWDMDVAALQRFAALVAAAEREECAKVCEGLPVPTKILGAHSDYLEGKRMAISQCAAAIRARGTA